MAKLLTLFDEFTEKQSKQALSDFLSHLLPGFYGIAYKYSRSHNDAEDIVQNAIIKIIEKAKTYRREENDSDRKLEIWCLSIVVNCALMYQRSEKNRSRREKIEGENRMTDKPKDESVFQSQLHLEILKKLNELPEKYKIPISLRYVEGLSLNEISEVLQMNHGTLRSLVKRGLDKIRNSVKTSAGVLSLTVLLMNLKSINLAADEGRNRLFEEKQLDSLLSSLETSSLLSKPLFSVVSVFKLVGLMVLFSGIYFSLDLQKYVEPYFEKQNTYFKEIDFSLAETQKNYLDIKGIEWSKAKGGFGFGFNEPYLINIPLKNLPESFVIECVVFPHFRNETHLELSLGANFITANGSGKHKAWKSNERFIWDTPKAKIVKFYKIRNRILAYRLGKFCQMTEYTDNDPVVYLKINLFNFGVKNIVIKELEDHPKNQELYHAFDKHETFFFEQDSLDGIKSVDLILEEK